MNYFCKYTSFLILNTSFFIFNNFSSHKNVTPASHKKVMRRIFLSHTFVNAINNKK